MQAPQPYEEIEHTADLGVVVRGSSAEETLERLVCVFGQLLAGRDDLEPSTMQRLVVPAAPDRALVAVDVLRELLFRFATEKLIAASCEALRLDDGDVELEVGFAHWDPQAHAGGADIKAVTYHEAAFERAGDQWLARVIFDI